MNEAPDTENLRSYMFFSESFKNLKLINLFTAVPTFLEMECKEFKSSKVNGGV